MKNKLVQISAKNLGILALPDYCPRCFYLKLKLGFKLPWQIFPGIFSSIDSYSKKITWGYYQKFNRLPPWFSKFGKFVKPVPSPHFSKFYTIDADTNVKLTGIADEIFLMEEKLYFIVDYKTARYTYAQDELMPVYRVQLNGYAMIFEKMGMGKVVGLGLVYYEPDTEVDVGRLDSLLVNGGFNMRFSAHLVEVGLDPVGVVLPLLKVVRELGDREVVPEGRTGCQDCGRLGEIMKIVR